MRRRYLVLLTCLAVFCAWAQDWPQFRGPSGDGISTEASVPVTWSESENIRWKVALPGTGWSSPVIADGEIWVTAATDNERSLRAISLDAGTGKLKANVEVFRLDSAVAGHSKNSGASPSPVIEDDRVYVHFGSYGTACLRRDGSIRWRSQELKYTQAHGPAGSPVLFEDLVILNCDGHDTQFVAALNKETGKVVWRSPRPSAMAYSTPLVIRTPSGPQLVSPGAHRAISYDPRTGTPLWFVNYGDGFSNVPRPVFSEGIAYVCTGFYQPQLLAVRVDGRGDVTGSHIVWKYSRGVPLTSSPVIAGEELYMVSDNGIATCLNRKTGEEHWRQRFGGSYSASPLFAGGRIYFLSESGEMTVIEAGREFRTVATNQLDGRFLASPAVYEHNLFLRSETHLYRIGE